MLLSGLEGKIFGDLKLAAHEPRDRAPTQEEAAMTSPTSFYEETPNLIDNFVLGAAAEPSANVLHSELRHPRLALENS